MIKVRVFGCETVPSVVRVPGTGTIHDHPLAVPTEIEAQLGLKQIFETPDTGLALHPLSKHLSHPVQTAWNVVIPDQSINQLIHWSKDQEFVSLFLFFFLFPLFLARSSLLHNEQKR